MDYHTTSRCWSYIHFHTKVGDAVDTYIWFVPHELCLCYWRVRYLSLTCLFGNDSIDTFWVWVFTVFGSGHMKALVSKSAKWLTLCTTQKIVECQTSSYIILYNLNSYVLTQTIILCTLSGHFKFTIALFSFKSLYNKFFSNNHLQTIFRCRLSSHFSAQSKIKLKHCLGAGLYTLILSKQPKFSNKLVSFSV